MPKLVKLYIMQSFVGFALSTAFVGMLLWFDVARLWYLVTHTSAGPLAVFLLWLFNGIVFAGVQFAISIMRMEEKEIDPGAGGPKVRLEPQPVLAKVDTKRNVLSPRN
ncbi:hypothetical protein VK792_08890 [Mesobacterium sp. TK19101]|uniref:Uncharacterized protein n=1 Tax=Mesobacterium hydrothermale TaxID=3111907 RepID=A0ABU6HIY2_9RHOB|nr:hypothetical protein [Mesobacterium sp. TK19101]MEC3861398.1 hypothetical protein [Mesobacterium sp. TK19101]